MTTPTNDGGTAFPRPVSFSEEGGTHRGTLGMSLRDWFAGQALAGIAPVIELQVNKLKLDGKYFDGYQHAAVRAYCYADAMLVLREHKEGHK